MSTQLWEFRVDEIDVLRPSFGKDKKATGFRIKASREDEDGDRFSLSIGVPYSFGYPQTTASSLVDSVITIGFTMSERSGDDDDG